jgi:hypothetical protein
VRRAIAGATLAVSLAACPSPPVGGTDGDGAHEGGERPVGSSSPLPDSPLDPIRDQVLEGADVPEGARVAALVVRADVGFAASDPSADLEWQRVGLVLAPFGLRLFERAPRGVTRDDHGAPASDPSVAPIASALAAATPLTADECATLPEGACEPLSSLEIADEVAARPVRRIAIATVGTLPLD